MGTDPVSQAGEARPIPACSTTDAVVVDAHVQVGAASVDVQPDMCGARVLHGVGDRLGRDVIGGRLDVVGQLGRRPADRHRYRN